MSFFRLAFCVILSFIFLTALDVNAQKNKHAVAFMPKEESLDKMFSGEISAWELTPEMFEKEWKTFKWLNKEKKTGARYHSVNNMDVLTLFGMKVWEAIITFEKGVFDKIEISFYNRGDAESSVSHDKNGIVKRKLSSDEFKKLLKDLDSKLNDFMQVKGKALPPMKITSTATNQLYVKYWVKEKQCAGLEWNVKEVDGNISPEFLKMVYKKYDPNNDPRRQTTWTRNTGKLDNTRKIKDNVVTKDGFTYIDNIPMVDQGPKGYCAAAATTRILQYYGSELDMHQVGALIKVTAGGTDPAVMLKQLKKATPKLGTKVYTYMDPPEFTGNYSGDTKKYLAEIKDFNKMLERSKMSPVPIGYPIIASTRGEQLALFKEFKTKKKSSYYKKFLANIKKNIDQGIPVAWGLFLGFVKEDGKTPQSMGGHMRLIIGYNKDMSQLVFTDTWGAGHEYKTIDSGDAFIVTSFYGILKPKK